jgi:carboxylesterase
VRRFDGPRGEKVPVRPSAHPYQAGDGPVGVLLCHGFTGSPASMRPWAEHLAGAGCSVSLPRLPGHGTTWQELSRTRWEDWYAELAGAFQRLRDRCDHVVVCGLSLGGCLALRLAEAEGSGVAGLVLVNPALASDDAALRAVPILRHVLRSRPGITNDIKNPGVDEGGYDRVPLRAVHSMLALWRLTRDDLPKVTSPLLLLRSAEDHVVDQSSARVIMSRVSSTDVEERLLHDSYHVATLDHDAETIFRWSAAFISRVTDRPRCEAGDAR